MKQKLTVTAVKNIKAPGRHNDGGGLYLKITPQGSRSWVFRYRDRGTGKHRDMGLGPFPDVGLVEARQAALAQRKVLQGDRDPITERARERSERRAELGKIPTFDQCAELYIAAHEPAWANPKHVAQWRATLKTYASPVVGSLPVNLVTSDHVLKILTPIWQSKTETASRVRGRVESVLDWAASPSRRYREGDNPARWRGHLDKELARPTKVKKAKHHAALDFKGMHEFMGQLGERQGTAARCLEFTVLTATRTGESIGARWSEIDLDAALWTIPAERMKAKREHRVPLSKAALGVLKGQQGHDPVYVFPGAKADSHLSNMAMLELIKEMKKPITVHGFRSSFRDWAGETTSFAREVCEMALAHVLKDKTEAAYFRADLFEKRAKLMQAWAKHCYTKPAKGNVVPFAGAAS